MSIDLTRFDFHALRFKQSEDVQLMTDAEIGQYVMLMVEAWLSGKNASLPDNPTLLARYAHCDKVSDKVLAKWQPGPDGRLYNGTLSEEWEAALDRSAEARERANKRWRKGTDAPAMPTHSSGNAQTVPYRLKPNQADTVPTQIAPAGDGGRVATISSLDSDTVSDSISDHVIDMINDFDKPEESAANLAGLLHSTLPADKTDKNIGAWESEWTKDFLGLLEDVKAERIAKVIKTLPRLKMFKYVHRAAYFCEHFIDIEKVARKAKLL